MIIFVNDGKYVYRFAHHEIIMKKEKNKILLNIFYKSENKYYSMEVLEEQLKYDDYFQLIKTEYNVLQLFGLTNLELFAILLDNSIKKNNYHISWYKMSPLNIRTDSVKLKFQATPNIELVFELNFTGY